MTEYFVTFITKLSAKNQKDLNRKAEMVAETLSKSLKKKVEPFGYSEIEKKDEPSVQTKLE